MTSNPLVYVIVLNYNGISYLSPCLSSIEKQTYTNYKTIVFDNASTEDSALEFILSQFPETKIFKGKKNFGFAKANNLAIQFALKNKADYVFLVNNDTELEADLLEKLVSTAENDASVGITAPVILDLKDKTSVQEMGMAIDRFGYPLAIKEPAAKHFCFFVSGCAMLIRSSLFGKIGFFDEKYFMFAEDLDACWRARLVGYKTVLSEDAHIYHAGGGSISGGVIKGSSYTTNAKRVFLREKNTIRTLIKNYDTYNMISVVPLYVLLLLFEAFFWLCVLKPDISGKILKAILWNLSVLPDTFRARALVQGMRMVGDSEVVSRMRGGYDKLNVFRLVGIPKFVNHEN